jgi:Tfp pilus assembly protein PilE
MILQYKHTIRCRSAGVTLVEIALVVLIIGLLIAGVLGYREIIRIHYLKKMATEAQSFGIAARTFEQKYDALPGDFADASEMIAGCQSGNPYLCQDGDGNGTVGRYCHWAWMECYQTGATIPSTDQDGNSIPRRIPVETSMFWKHLYLSGIITSGIVPTANHETPVWGQSHPKAAIEGAGFTVSGGTSFLGGNLWVNLLPTPQSNPQGLARSASDAVGERAVSIRDAQWLDRKYDNDGPGSGLMWWSPMGDDSGNGCRRNDGHLQNTWEPDQIDRRNCIMNWSVY